MLHFNKGKINLVSNHGCTLMKTNQVLCVTEQINSGFFLLSVDPKQNYLILNVTAM